MPEIDDKVLRNGVIKKFLPHKEDNLLDPFNEIELTHADVAAQTDRTIVVRMHSVDINTPELLKLAKETYNEMRKERNDP